MEKPRSREFRLVRELDRELIIVDSRHDVAHRLAPEAAAVWRACDGSRDAAALSSQAGLDADRVRAVLGELRERDLLEDAPGDTRRSMLRKAVIGGAAAASVPLVTSVVMPTAAQAFDSGHQYSDDSTSTPRTTSSSGAPSTTGPAAGPTTGSSTPASVTPTAGTPRGTRAPRRTGSLHVAGAHSTKLPSGGRSVLGAGTGIAPSGGGAGHLAAGSLPFTGADILRTAGVGTALIAAGAAARAYAGPPPEA